jgi:hypothetical protein
MYSGPSGDPTPLKVEIDSPTGRADLHPYLAAKLAQFWLVIDGQRNDLFKRWRRAGHGTVSCP